MPEYKSDPIIFNFLPAGKAVKVAGKGITKISEKIAKRKPTNTKREVDIEKLLTDAVKGPDKRTPAQKRAAEAYFKSTFREP
tara:strand:+ start:5663 stop:5908 length:246 start_codon:yes stop_codon:yes gene_type:complete